MQEFIPAKQGGIIAVLLAAGMSQRLGFPKQTLIFQGESLIRRQLKVLTESTADQIIVVTGASREACVAEIHDLSGWQEMFHIDYARGMGSSIKAVVRYIEENISEVQGVLFTICDQIYLTSKHIDLVIETFKTQPNMAVASSYADNFGIPALFPHKSLQEFKQIEDQQGAKVILKQLGCLCVELPGGEVDIDRPEDLLALSAKYQGS